MRTATYLVHDSDTGEVIHVHVEPVELHSSPDEIARIAGPARDRNLAVALLPEEMPGSRPVHLVDGRPTPQDTSNWGHAAIASRVEEPDVTRHYSPDRPGAG